MVKTARAPVTEYSSLTLDEANAQLINASVALLQRVWPTDKDEADRLDRYIREQRSRNQARMHLLKTEKVVVAHAITFARETFSEGDTLPVTALAGVCVDPDLRGLGLGYRLMEQICAESSRLQRLPLLFQTEIPEFYTKLSAGLIDNQFFNSRAEQDGNNPWSDPHVMIYPADYPWPHGPIDLNGAAY